MQREFRHSLKNHFKEFEFSISTTLMGLTTLIIIQVYAREFMGSFFTVFVLVTFLPVIYLYIEYYSFNKKGATFKIDCVKAEIVYTDKKSSQIVKFDEIDEVWIHATLFWTRSDRAKRLPFEQFHYARIYTKKGEIIVSSHLADNVKDAVKSIPNVRIEQTSKIFPSILLE